MSISCVTKTIKLIEKKKEEIRSDLEFATVREDTATIAYNKGVLIGLQNAIDYMYQTIGEDVAQMALDMEGEKR